MLSVNNYHAAYLESCRGQVARQLDTYDALVSAARAGGASDEVIRAFERDFFNHLVVALDAYFVHRARGLEGKDGNPLNEVRVLASSVLHDDGHLAADKTIKLKPETSVLGYAVGDEIRLDVAAFRRLAEAYLAEIEAKYG